jgi:hypothetical protein
MITHGNLLHNSAVICRLFGTDRESEGVFWLPLFHDMGLIGGALQTIYCGGSSTLLAPAAFLSGPCGGWRSSRGPGRSSAGARTSPTTCAPARPRRGASRGWT